VARRGTAYASPFGLVAYSPTSFYRAKAAGYSRPDEAPRPGLLVPARRLRQVTSGRVYGLRLRMSMKASIPTIREQDDVPRSSAYCPLCAGQGRRGGTFPPAPTCTTANCRTSTARWPGAYRAGLALWVIVRGRTRLLNPLRKPSATRIAATIYQSAAHVAGVPWRWQQKLTWPPLCHAGLPNGLARCWPGMRRS